MSVPDVQPNRCFHRLIRTFCLLTAGLLAIAPCYAAQREFNLSIDEVAIKVAPDLDYYVFAFNGQVPGPLIHVQEGDDIVVNVTNNTTLPHTIHWHGIYQMNNWQFDGVPGVTQPAIEPGNTFTYRWKAEKVGTLWYHCHVNVHEHVGVRGMWGPLIVDPKNPSTIEKKVTKDAIIMLSSWDSKYATRYGEGGGPHDLPNYFSMNGRAFPLTQPIRVEKGDVLRLRFIGAGGEIHSMHPHGHDMLVTHKDGLPLPNPYYADTLLLGPGERYDVIMEMNNPGLWMMHDHVDPHVTNNGQSHGGPMTVFEYTNVQKPEFYHFATDVKFDSNFFYSDSMKKGYGMFEHEGFKGAPINTRERRKKKESGHGH